MGIKLSEIVDDGSPLLRKLLGELTGMQVLVGVPEDKAGRKEDDINNAQLMYIHTNGSELNGIPARPVIEPAIEAKGNKEQIEEKLAAAARSVLDDDRTGAARSMKLAGMIGQNASRAWFTDPKNGWAPNTPGTISAKGSDKPLIDTGQLRKSIVYVVKE